MCLLLGWPGCNTRHLFTSNVELEIAPLHLGSDEIWSERVLVWFGKYLGLDHGSRERKGLYETLFLKKPRCARALLLVWYVMQRTGCVGKDTTCSLILECSVVIPWARQERSSIQGQLIPGRVPIGLWYRQGREDTLSYSSRVCKEDPTFNHWAELSWQERMRRIYLNSYPSPLIGEQRIPQWGRKDWSS